MNKNKGKRGGRSSRGTSRAGNPGRQQAKAAAAPEAAQHEAVMDTTAATPPPPSAGGEYAQQVDENGKQVGKYKTKLCVFNASPQGCPYGTECLFAHGTDELRPDLSGRKAPSSSVQQNPLYKTKLCVHWSTSGGKFCPHSSRCVFAHGMHELRAIGARPDGADGSPSAGTAPAAADAGHANPEAAAKAARRALTMARRNASAPPPLGSSPQDSSGHHSQGGSDGTPSSSVEGGSTPASYSHSVPSSPIVPMDPAYSTSSPPGGAPPQGMYMPPHNAMQMPMPTSAQMASIQQFLMAANAQAPGVANLQVQMQYMQQMTGQHMRFQQQGGQGGQQAQGANGHMGPYHPSQSAQWPGQQHQHQQQAFPAAPLAASLRPRCLKLLGEIAEKSPHDASILLGTLRSEDPPLFAAVQETAARLGQQLPALPQSEGGARQQDSPPLVDSFSTHLGGAHSAPAGLMGGTPMSLSTLGEVGGLGASPYGSGSAAAPWGTVTGNVWGDASAADSTPPPDHTIGGSFATGPFETTPGLSSVDAFGGGAFASAGGGWSAPASDGHTAGQPTSALSGGWDGYPSAAGVFEQPSSAGVWG